MFKLVRSELLKLRHTFSMKLPVVAPIMTLLLGYVLQSIWGCMRLVQVQDLLFRQQR